MTYFHSIPQCKRQDGFPPPPFLFIYAHICIYFYMFYRDLVIQILYIWGSPNSICMDLSWQRQSSQFRFPRYWIYFQISFSLPLFFHLFFLILHFFLPLIFLLSFTEIFFSVSYSLIVEHSKYISRSKFHKCAFLVCYHLVFNKLPYEGTGNYFYLWQMKINYILAIGKL